MRKHGFSLSIVMDSISTTNGGIVSVLNAKDNDNAPLIVSITPNGTGVYLLNSVDSNFITSIYGKDRSFSNFISNAAENDKILFWDKNKSQDLFSSLKLQLPEALNNLTAIWNCISISL